MTRTPVLCMLVVAGCGAAADEAKGAEANTSTTEGDDLGDDVPPLEPCGWTPAPASECDITFGPVPDEIPAPDVADVFMAGADIIALADSVEILWQRSYWTDDIEDSKPLQLRSYVTSNAGGAWQHQFVYADPCPDNTCSADGPPRMGGVNRIQVTPPYLRREAGQWQVPIVDARTDPITALAYADPQYFAVGPDDRSYFESVSAEPEGIVRRLWTQTDLGCHQPTWELHGATCPDTQSVAALAVDAAGLVHMTGFAWVSPNDWRIVHWRVLPDRIEGHELARLPASPDLGEQDLAIGEFGEVHLCTWGLADGSVAFYGHGYDAADWTTVEIDDPDDDGTWLGQLRGFCKLALATDGTVWLTWQANDGVHDLSHDPFRVASIEDDEIFYETIDVGVDEVRANLTVDRLGRPWIAYWHLNSVDTLEVAHKEGDDRSARAALAAR